MIITILTQIVIYIGTMSFDQLIGITDLYDAGRRSLNMILEIVRFVKPITPYIGLPCRLS